MQPTHPTHNTDMPSAPVQTAVAARAARHAVGHVKVIQLQALAPKKPVWGDACNGCGVCCATEPCPVGIVLTGKTTGACAALRWSEAESRYHCGALVDANNTVAQELPRGLGWTAPAWVGLLKLAGPRWISAGTGCDCSLEVEAASLAPTCAQAVGLNSTDSAQTAQQPAPLAATQRSRA
jgi:hypothetical protein